MQPVREIDGRGPLPIDRLMAEQQPTILRGAIMDWPLVAAGHRGTAAAMTYLRRFDAGHPVVAYSGPPAIGGRFFYTDDLTALNFHAERAGLGGCLDRIAETLEDSHADAIYIGSTDLDAYLPGLGEANPIGLSGKTPLVSIWIGNRTIAATHYDMSNNLAACAVGRRRFTLFPPDQIANLYPGPLEPTPGGQVVSMVDLRAPDLDRYPRFADALAQSQVAELEPGDMLFYPALWWHNVEALDAFNVMINAWWNDSPPYMDTPMTTLLHALLSLRDRPEPEKQAWRAMFDYYVFDGQAAAHLPGAAQGDLAPMDERRARALRGAVLRRLNR
jgi:hypothetical protein